MAVAHLGLGANLGDRAANLKQALRLIAQSATVTGVSPLYETEPVGPEQPLFYNAVCEIETALAPRELLVRLKEMEREVGRSPRTERWGPREIDIDILLYGEQVIEEKDLTIPHPQMLERAFVLVPLAEIAADVHHPVRGETIGDLAALVDAEGVRKVADAGWERAIG